jgi:translation initiation factor IF-2
MTTSTGKSLKAAPAGTPVEVTGWKERPKAGDLVLQAPNESDAKLTIRNRITASEHRRDMEDIETLNEKRQQARRERWYEREKRLVAEETKRSGTALPGILKEEVKRPKEFRVIVKADVSGSAEAVEEAICDLGNDEVKVVVIDASVGEITESDVQKAIAAEGMQSRDDTDCAAKIVGFNIRALNPNLRPLTSVNNTEIFNHTIIYKLIEDVIARLESMLPPKIELTVTGEGEVSEIFDVTIKNKKRPIAGTKVFNGVISLKEKCRVTRNGKIVYSGMFVRDCLLMTGQLDTLRHFKKDVIEIRKGSDCGLSFEDYDELKVGDLVQSYKEIEVPRKLYV